MIKNNIKIAFRKIFRQKLYSFINVGGLALGIAAAILIFSIITNERSYDRFNKNCDSIYRIIVGNIGEPDAWAHTPAPLGPALKDNFPEIKDYVRLNFTSAFVKANEKSFSEKKVLYADPSLFRIFSFPLLSGNVNEILSDPNDIVISSDAAKKYFGARNPLGQTMVFNGKDEYHVTGVFENVPKNSHLHFNMVIPFQKFYTGSWNTYNYSTYILTGPHVDEKVLLGKIRHLEVKHINQSESKFESLNLQPLTKIHFQYIRGNYETVYTTKFIYILGSVAFFILLLAAVNYINMTTALAPTRAKEVGIKKVSGSGRGRLVLQFMTESFLQTAAAVICAVILIGITAPILGEIFEKEVPVNLLGIPMITALIGITLFMGLLGGIYPAFLMSHYKPAVILKGGLLGKKKSILRNFLVVFQFCISVVLIIGTLISSKQLRFLMEKDLGMDKDLIVNVNLNSPRLINEGQELKNEFLKNSNVLKASVNSFQLGNDNWHQSVFWKGQTKDATMYIFNVDKDFFSTYGIKFTEGEDKVRNYVPGNPYGFVINESALKETGWKNAVGKNFSAFSNPPKEIALGVVKDFNFRTLYHPVEPCAIVITNKGSLVSVKLANRNIPETLESLKTTVKSFDPSVPFDYYFVNDKYFQLYDSERSSSRAILFFSILSVLISGLGLFGLASFITIQKTKEIGIRKVLGASVPKVIFLLSGEFIRWVIVANIIGWPIAYFLMNKWLQDFAYKINFSWWTFISAGGITLIVALATVSFQAIKAATVNPVESLRYE